jgi:exodeoxyribonuclease VII large subunit
MRAARSRGESPEARPRKPAARERDVYTVSRLNREVRLLLDHGMPGCGSRPRSPTFSRPASGHWYFTLKDRDAQVRCAMFRQRNPRPALHPADGQLVLARARVGPVRAARRLPADRRAPRGTGRRRRAASASSSELKEEARREGLFDQARKRPLPPVPRRIGVVTSPSGAAVRDILHILGRRFPAPPVLIYPTPCRAPPPSPRSLAALELAAGAPRCDVLIVARGGGSLEDLWPSTTSASRARSRACPMPVVSGVGHEVDFTIADFVADVRAPTPSGAAELVVPDRRDVADVASSWAWAAGWNAWRSAPTV